MNSETLDNPIEKKSLFREEALDKMNSNEHLDKLMQLTSMRLWLVFLACAIVIAIAVIWGVFGKIPTQVRGTGIIINLSGMKVIQSPANGIITSINVRINDKVNQGQIIGRIRQPELISEIKSLRNEIDFAESQVGQMQQMLAQDAEIQLAYLKEQDSSLEKSLKRLVTMRDLLEKDAAIYKKLLKDGAVSKMEEQQQIFYMMRAEMDVFNQQDKLANLPYRRFKVHTERKRQLMQKRKELKSQRVRLVELENKLRYDSIITSPFTGTIIEINRGRGQNVNRGSPILIVNDHTVKDLQAIVFFPPTEGKRVEAQMPAFISPTTVKANRYGYIRGIVSDIHDYPSTENALYYILRNSNLARQLSLDSAPITATVELMPDRHTLSGFEWTSSNGPPFPIKNGTLCNLKVTVREDAPISLVIPYIKKRLLGQGDNQLLKSESSTVE